MSWRAAAMPTRCAARPLAQGAAGGTPRCASAAGCWLHLEGHEMWVVRRGGHDPRAPLRDMARLDDPQQLRHRQLVGDDDPLQGRPGALRRGRGGALVLVLLGVLRRRAARPLQELAGLREGGLRGVQHHAALRRGGVGGDRRGLLEVAEGGQVGEPEVLEGPEPQDEALREAADGRQQPVAQAEDEDPEEAADHELRRLEEQQGGRGSPRPQAAAPRLLLLLLPPAPPAGLLPRAPGRLLLGVVQLVQVVDAEAVEVVHVPVDHVDLGLVVEVELEAEEELRDHHLEAVLHDPHPAGPGVPQVRAERLLEVLVELPRLVLEGVELGEDVGQAPEPAGGVGVRQLEEVREQRLAVAEERLHRLLAVLRGLPGEEVQLQGLQHHVGDGARQHVRLVLVGDGALEHLHQGLLGEAAAEQQLVDVRRPHLERRRAVVDGLNGSRRARHEELPVDGGVEAQQLARLRGAGGLLQLLNDAEARGKPAPGLLRALLATGQGLLPQLHQGQHVFAQELQPQRGSLAIAAEGRALRLEALPHLPRVRGEDGEVQVDAEHARQEVLVVEDPALMTALEERHRLHEPLEVVQVEAAEARLHDRVALEPEQVVHQQPVPDGHQLWRRQVARDDPRLLCAVQRHVLAALEPGVHLRVHDLDGGHRVEEPEVRALDELAQLHPPGGQAAHARDVDPVLGGLVGHLPEVVLRGYQSSASLAGFFFFFRCFFFLAAASLSSCCPSSFACSWPSSSMASPGARDTHAQAMSPGSARGA
eukprot:CAMPEP_0179259494 /NCGR_PEP_ID=MMETSP0797-20121207/25854_1 /TAXON_ID=47934 /ORGANISM="Dinophysis acuminata, Strain DAEP01" /LENGTH=761 /DNA_ID=CAMNT_0020967547 /DNA_START=218 /DNA_END=2506 /DNA_ORIENTATION=-